MKKSMLLISAIIFLSLFTACGSDNATPEDLPDEDQVATIVAGTLSAIPSATSAPGSIATPLTPDSPTSPDSFDLSVNGQLKGILVFIRDDNLWVSINGIESQLTTDAISTELPYFTGLPALWYSNPQISPDGNKVAYLRNMGTEARGLMVSDIDGKNARQIVNDVAWTLPVVEWSNDSQRIYYLVSTGNDVTTGLETMIVESVNPDTGDVVEQGRFYRSTGCGGGSEDIADHLVGDEGIGYLGKGKIFVLSLQNDYVMHSTSCSDGLGILNLSTNQDIMLDDGNVSAAAISADGSSIAAISGNNIVIFNIINGNIEQTFSTLDSPRALSWGNNETTIFYSTSKLIGTQDLDASISLDVFNKPSNSITLYLSTLWKLSLDTGESMKIIEMDAHDLKPIFATDQTVLVNAIENTNVLFDYLSQGNRENLVEHYPSVNMVEVDLAELTSNVIMHKTLQADYRPIK